MLGSCASKAQAKRRCAYFILIGVFVQYLQGVAQPINADNHVEQHFNLLEASFSVCDEARLAVIVERPRDVTSVKRSIDSIYAHHHVYVRPARFTTFQCLGLLQFVVPITMPACHDALFQVRCCIIAVCMM